MAKPRDLLTAAAARADELRGTVTPIRRGPEPFTQREVAERVEDGQAIEALALRMAGLTYPQIAERIKADEVAVRLMVEAQVGRAVNRRAEDMRELENLRLDRLFAARWTDALKGDHNAVQDVLQISQARRRMNGLDEPKRIAIAANVRLEMQQALNELQSIVMGEVVAEALTEGDRDEDDDDGR